MEISRTSVPGVGFIHHCVTRDGQRFGVLVERSGRREMFAYAGSDSGEIIATIVLDDDEADYLASILHSRALSDRIDDLERRFGEIAGSAS